MITTPSRDQSNTLINPTESSSIINIDEHLSNNSIQTQSDNNQISAFKIAVTAGFSFCFIWNAVQHYKEGPLVNLSYLTRWMLATNFSISSSNTILSLCNRIFPRPYFKKLIRHLNKATNGSQLFTTLVFLLWIPTLFNQSKPTLKFI